MGTLWVRGNLIHCKCSYKYRRDKCYLFWISLRFSNNYPLTFYVILCPYMLLYLLRTVIIQYNICRTMCKIFNFYIKILYVNVRYFDTFHVVLLRPKSNDQWRSIVSLFLSPYSSWYSSRIITVRGTTNLPTTQVFGNNIITFYFQLFNNYLLLSDRVRFLILVSLKHVRFQSIPFVKVVWTQDQNFENDWSTD